MKNDSGTLTKSWYFLGFLVWESQRNLTLEEQAFEIKKETLMKTSRENEPATLTKRWYLLGILIWKTQRTLTLEEQAFQIKKEVLTEINQEIDKAFNNPKTGRVNAQ